MSDRWTPAWNRHVNHYGEDGMCVSCGDEEADPDSLEGQCFICMEGEDE
jgi:hypothetical protein